MVEHDRATGVFRSPQPSMTLSEIRGREIKKDLIRSGQVLVEEAVWLDEDLEDTQSDALHSDSALDDVAIRGGLDGGNPWDDLWMAQERDVGADLPAFDQSTEDAQIAWEEAAESKHDDEEWHALEGSNPETSMANLAMSKVEGDEWQENDGDSMNSGSEQWAEESDEDK